MGRKPRIEYAGATYHVMCRGNRRADIFANDGDRMVFLETLSEVCERTGWEICAYVLMSNHYHLIVQTPEANLVDGMKWFQGTYTKRYNARNREWGHLFQGRYKSVVIDPDEPDYFHTACDYVHLNPARARLVGGKNQPLFREYEWSSSWYLSQSIRQDPAWLKLSRIVEEQGRRETSQVARLNYLLDLEKRCAEEQKRAESDDGFEGYRSLRRGWCFCGNEYKEKLKEVLFEQLQDIRRDSVVGEPRRMHDEHEAVQLLNESCRITSLKLEMKDRLRKNDSRKQVIAWLLFKKTAMGQEWIAEQLGMGNRVNVSRAIKEVDESAKGEVLKWRKELAKMYGCVH